jgi:hypothetical protein
MLLSTIINYQNSSYRLAHKNALPGDTVQSQIATYRLAHKNALPGDTMLPEEDLAPITLPPFMTKKKVIVLASNEINDDSLFLNGLTQNIVILYDLFEALGYTCKLMQTTVSNNKKTFLEKYNYIKSAEIIAQPHIHIFIEIGKK